MFRRHGKRIAAVAALLVGVGLAGAAYGADAPPKAAAPSQTLFDIINAGGVVEYFLLFMNVVAIALAIEHFMTVRRSIVMPPELLADIEDCFEKEEYEQAMSVCEEQPTFLTNVVAAGLSRVNAGYKQMEEAMNAAGEEAATSLQQKIGYLSLIANLGPMLGLLGTTASMIIAFTHIATSEAPKASELANDIQLALVTTFTGLLTAIFATCLFHYFKNRVQKLVLEVGGVSSELMARFRPVE
jgi:biopolymer transport protein ExbB